VAGFFFLSCDLVTGGFPFSGGVSVRDSGVRPSFFGRPCFLPLGAMVAGGGLRSKGVGAVRAEIRGEGESPCYSVTLYQGREVNFKVRGPKGAHKGVCFVQEARVVSLAYWGSGR